MKLKKVEMSPEALEEGKEYIWALPSGEKKVVSLSEDGAGIDEWDDGWSFEDDLVGELYGPIELDD